MGIYKIVERTSVEELEKAVNYLIEKNYIPIGGIATLTSGSLAPDRFYQAMINEFMEDGDSDD